MARTCTVCKCCCDRFWRRDPSLSRSKTSRPTSGRRSLSCGTTSWRASTGCCTPGASKSRLHRGDTYWGTSLLRWPLGLCGSDLTSGAGLYTLLCMWLQGWVQIRMFGSNTTWPNQTINTFDKYIAILDSNMIQIHIVYLNVFPNNDKKKITYPLCELKYRYTTFLYIHIQLCIWTQPCVTF